MWGISTLYNFAVILLAFEDCPLSLGICIILSTPKPRFRQTIDQNRSLVWRRVGLHQQFGWQKGWVRVLRFQTSGLGHCHRELDPCLSCLTSVTDNCWLKLNPQLFYRRWKARREAKKQKAAVLIQSGVRGLIERRNYLRQRRLIIYLQAVVRAQRCYKKYHQVKNVTLFIQRRVRENMVAKNVRREFLEMKRAVVSLQSGYRGWKSRYLVCRLKAVLLIQRWFRAKMVARMARAEYQRIKNATLLIQASYRGYCGRIMARKIRAVRISLSLDLSTFGAQNQSWVTCGFFLS